MQVQVRSSLPLSMPPTVLVQQDGAEQGMSVTLVYDAAQDLYIGQADLNPALAPSGYVFVHAEEGDQAVEKIVPFALETVLAGQYEHLQSPDGNLELVLREDTLGQDAVLSIQQSTEGTGGQGDLVRVSPAYQVLISTGGQSLAATATMHMRYLSDQLRSVWPGTLQLYRWDETTGMWLPVGGDVAAAWSLVSADVQQLGVFALLGPGARIYLPVLGHQPR
jgi:hypothetical protein